MKPKVRKRIEGTLPYLPIAKTIINSLSIGDVGDCLPAPWERDVKEATDLEIKVQGKDVSLRTRHYTFEAFEDFTLRSPTEIDKLRAGYGHIYLFIWTGQKEAWKSPERYKGFVRYKIFSTTEARKAGVFDQDWPYKPNIDPETGKRDGTGFISIPDYVLEPFIIREGDAVIDSLGDCQLRDFKIELEPLGSR